MPGESEVTPIRLKTIEGVPGLASADQHVLDAEVLAVAAALVHMSRHVPGGADPLRWTVNKLLLGGGVGADPTEVDLPTIATGTYTGNDADNRQITTGFKCSMAVVWANYGLGEWWFTIGTKNMYFISGVYPDLDLEDLTLHATDGFVVDHAKANESPVGTYNYWAISE